ncbi:FG-GAP repeat domain-containing protein [Streptomyces huiliensis]|uniref:FG-GAP repeat domain-containing protein n=1 Tax=Streptomyces huiliensis TaxID=2876027 RepID=UPI001CBAD51B|nr:VCBS repeat-containing protein [Streptomyces huiliensis]MBZ4317793.1 VCBS repeat-containing protein [Streptomyces huiliensis]
MHRLPRVAAAAAAAALVVTAAGAAVADEGTGRAAAMTARQRLARVLPGDAPHFPLEVVDGAGKDYTYMWDGKGGLERRTEGLGDLPGLRAATQVDTDSDNVYDSDAYFLTADHKVILSRPLDSVHRQVASGWGGYDTFFSPGDLGGAKQPDLLTRDGQGVLWLHLAREDGSLTGAKKVGPGWGQYTQITGKGDLTGDGKTDIVARDKDGVLWLYKGTGDWAKPFQGRTRIGGGWNQFNLLLGAGDTDLDGRADLVARDKSGALWRYKGTGKASAPFAAKEKIGNSGWNQYRIVY